MVAGLSERSRERVLEFLRDEDQRQRERQREHFDERGSGEVRAFLARVPAGSAAPGAGAVELIEFLKG